MNLSMKQKQNHDIKNRLVVANRDGWSGTLGLADVKF